MTRRGSSTEVATWVALAVIVGSTAIALVGYMYLGLLSLILLPIVAVCWSRAIVLSAPAREGGTRNRVIGVLVVGTVVGGILFSWLARGLFGEAGIRD